VTARSIIQTIAKQQNNLMKKPRNQITSILFLLLSACSTQSTQPITSTNATTIAPAATVSTVTMDKMLPAPDLFLEKAGKTLKLVRIMEGGVCKNELQGVIGMFNLYVNPDDIVRIKKSQGSGVFSDFESQITEFSMLTLQQAVNQLDFQSDFYPSNKQDTQQQLANELTNSFIALIFDDIEKFETETTLSINVKPISNSIIIFLDGCKTPHGH
jgi:hypothetical protein